MAVRNPLIIVSGLFQELNTSSDKLNFAGNTTADLTENTNLYYTDARARASVSVTDSGGDGSLAYNSSTGVITYTGPSASEVRAHISVASGSGLTYSSGEIGTSAIPNSQLANDSLTIGSTEIDLGATQGTLVGLTSLASGTLIAGVEDAANAIEIGSGNIIFEGSTADAYEVTLTSADATSSDKTITLPDATGTVALLSTLSVAGSSGLTYNSGTGQFGTSAIPNAQLANSAVTIGSTSVSLGATVTAFTGLSALTSTTLTGTTLIAGVADAANAISITAGNITFEGSTADSYEIILTAADAASSDKTITLPNETGTVLTNASSIANSNLANSSLTIGSTAIALGATAASIAGVTSITSAAVVTDDDGFRVRDNSDATKQLAFECSGISGSTTRTMTIPDSDGTIATQAYVNAQITAEDLDISDGSSAISIDLNSETLTLAGGTGVTSTAATNTVTFAIDATVATLAGSQTLTNKTLTSPTINAATLTGVLDLTAGVLSGASPLIFEGSTADGNETTFAFVDPTADRTITFPDESGTMSTQSFATAIAVALG
tara:strand:+ start:10589 stop:12247 length:1659 start_codon:yes stop_codon:yes gene_type:complete